MAARAKRTAPEPAPPPNDHQAVAGEQPAGRRGRRHTSTAGQQTDQRIPRAALRDDAPPSDIKQQLGLLRQAFERDGFDDVWAQRLKLLRPHQWAKNALVVVPLLTAHQFAPSAIGFMLLAVAAFCACASSAYILNDIVDIEADRAHPQKCQRPLASGKLSIQHAAGLGACCLAIAFVVGASVSLLFAGVLALYLAGTTLYSLHLKRLLIVDAVTLAGLYTIRVVAGAVAIGVPMSEWLLAFSMFIFFSLALIKRYSELALRLDAALPDPVNRNYRVGDLPIIASLAAAAGCCAVVVLTLYLSSEAVRGLYRHPAVLWLACPLFLYWISRMLMLSHRRVVSEDPIVFTMTDKVSWVVGAMIVLLGVLAA
jgi:4-hydroxybenzoate polyprenyltransferase